MQIELSLELFVLIVVCTVVSLVFSFIAFWRSNGSSRLQQHHLQSLEGQIRILWNEVGLLRRAHDSANLLPSTEAAAVPHLMPQRASHATHEELAVRPASEGSPEKSIVTKSVPSEIKICPTCRSQWDGKRCEVCEHSVESVGANAAVQASPDLWRRWQNEFQSDRSLKTRKSPPVPAKSVEHELEHAAEMNPDVGLVHPWQGSPKRREHAGWESIIGASWLNKIGVLILVVGIALFIGYSLAHVGPIGRLVIAFAVSACMLVIGAALEKNSLYRMFGRGIAAGGWAGLYFTTYAMYGLEAVRVIDSPTLDFLLLISVAAGMIAHSLYFRAQLVTGLAYFCGFAAIAILPISLFSAVACVLLAGTLLFVAFRYSWHLLAVCGVVCTYGTFAIQFNWALYTSRIWLDFTTGHVVVGACWLLFEAFDIAVVAQSRQKVGLSRTLMPLNACGFLGLLLLQWRLDSSELYLLFVATAVAYIASAIVRAITRPISTFDQQTNSIGRIYLGSYEAAITIATALAAIAIWQKYPSGEWRLEVSWLLEAEFLFLTGVFLEQRYLRVLAVPVFVLVFIEFVAFELFDSRIVHVSALEFMHWTPLALVVAIIMYFNRSMLGRAQVTNLLPTEYSYSFFGTAFVILVLGVEIWLKHNNLRPEYLGISWLAVALVLLEVALRTRLVEFFTQSYLVGLLGVLVLFWLNGFLIYPDKIPTDTWQIWIWLFPAAIALYTTYVRLNRWRPVGLKPEVLAGLQQLTLAAATGLLVLFIWQAFPKTLVAVGWGICAWLLIQIGFAFKYSSLRWQGYIISGLMIGRLFFANFTNAGISLGISHRLLTVGPIVMFCYYLSGRLSGQQKVKCTTSVERSLSRVYLYAAAFVLLVLMRFELGRVLTVVGWSAYGVVLLYIGLHQNNKDLRWQSYLIALLTFGRSWGTNFYVPESLSGIFNPVMIGSLVTGSFYLSHLLCSARADRVEQSRASGIPGVLQRLDSHAKVLFCTLGTILLGVLLAYEMPGELLTAAWGIQGSILLCAGFVLRDRVFRLAGLGVLGICLPKLFLYDLQHLATPYRILSFIVLGLLLIIASWVYTRFKSQLQAYI